MKDFNLKHETLINFDIYPIEKEAKGETPHKKIVSGVEFYRHHWVGEQDIYLKVQISKDMIVDIYNSIMAVESTTVNATVSDLPF